MSTNPVRVLEQLNVFTPLGVRFWDPVQDRQIRDGLQVTAWPESTQRPVVTACRTHSDIYAFQGLPRLRDLEYGINGQHTTLSSPPHQQRFVVQVEDARRRFLPVALAIDLPLPYRGVFPRNSVHSPAQTSPPGFLLYSTIARPLPSWMTAVRGELIESASGQAAAHAVIRVQIAASGPSWFGLCDEQGRFAVYLPYPTLSEGIGASPPLGQGSLFTQFWQLGVQVYYQPELLLALAGSELPDYLSILSQTPAAIWQQPPNGGNTPATEWVGVLEYGKELNVTTIGLAHLLVSLAGSSP